MNIFILDRNPRKAASYLCDKHVYKMIIESFQMLCQCRRYYGDTENLDILYDPTHEQHKCTQWVIESKSNYMWLVEHVDEIQNQYFIRKRKIHASYKKLFDIVKIPMVNQPDLGLTPFVLAMPEEYKCEDPVKAYKNFYIYEKSYFAKWHYRVNIPYWYVLGMSLKNETFSPTGVLNVQACSKHS